MPRWAWRTTCSREASGLDKKTSALADLDVLQRFVWTAARRFRVKLAKVAGASQGRGIIALLVGLPAAGKWNHPILPAAIEADDAE